MSEDKIKKILQSYQVPAPPGAWERIAAGLDKQQAEKNQKKGGSHKTWFFSTLLVCLSLWPSVFEELLVVQPAPLYQTPVATLPSEPLAPSADSLAHATPVSELPETKLKVGQKAVPNVQAVAPSASRDSLPALDAGLRADAEVVKDSGIQESATDESRTAGQPVQTVAPDSAAVLPEEVPVQRSVKVVINLKTPKDTPADSTFQGAPQKKPVTLGNLLKELKRIKFDN